MFYTASYVDLLPFVIFVIFFAKTRNEKSLIVIAVYSIISVILLKITEFIPDYSKHLFYNLFVLVEYFAFALFILYNLRNATAKKLLLILSISFAVFLIAYTFKGDVKFIDSVSIGIESIAILIFAFYFLYELINEPKLIVFYTDYRFWILLGMIIYLAGSFFVYIFAEQLNPQEWKQYRFLTWVFYIFKALLFAVGTYVYSFHKKNDKQSNSKTIPYLDLTL